jgi:hypothetical protein
MLAAAGTDRRVSANVPTWKESSPKNQKPPASNLTLAAVGLDAYELLRSCTSSFVHDKERRVNRAHLLQEGAPGRAADDINRWFGVLALHKTPSGLT